MNILFSMVLAIGIGFAARSHPEPAGQTLLPSHVPLLRRGSLQHDNGSLDGKEPSVQLVNGSSTFEAVLTNFSSQILSSNHSGFVGNASSQNIYCKLKPRQFPSLPVKFMSSTPPFEEPYAKDYLKKKDGGGTTFLMRQFDVNVLKERKYMLDKLVSIFRKYRITYWLEAGTLLGAYRSHAFSPWDDDIDLSVPITFQKKLLGPVKYEAARLGIVINQLFFPPGNAYYTPIGSYIRHHAPRVAATTAGNATWGTLGYFCQAWYKGLKLDLWQAIPVELDGKVLYATGVGGHVLFSRKDVFPLRQLKFEGKSYNAPHRAHRYLVGIYGDITLPQWQHWYNAFTCTWNVLHSEAKKKPRSTKSKFFATIAFDSNGVPHMDVPEFVKNEVDSPKTFKKYWPLGGQASVVTNIPSGYGYPSYQLGGR